MKQDTIVYAYPGAAWSDYPGRQFMLTRALSRYIRVVYLECGTSQQGVGRPWYEVTPERVTVVHNAMRLRYTGVGKRLVPFSSLVDGVRLRCMLRSLDVHDYIYWVAANDPKLLQFMDRRKLIYDCIDPCFSPESQSEFDASELRICQRAKVVFATAMSLQERMRRLHPQVYLLPNGAPDGGLNGSYARPSPLRDVNMPVVGYMGTLDSRFDADSVAYAATALPDVYFCLVGRVNREQSMAADQLRALKNVCVTGAVSQAEGEAYMAAFDVGIIPFHEGEIGDAINPCKMYMHLHAGAPVVATYIRECRNREPWVIASKSRDRLPEAILRAIALSKHGEIQRKQYAAANSWSARAQEAVRYLQQSGLMAASIGASGRDHLSHSHGQDLVSSTDTR